MTGGYERPSSTQPQLVEAPKVRVSFWAICEIPDPDHDGRFLVKHSPSFPNEKDVRDWRNLHVSRGEVRMYRREVKPGTVNDIELDRLEAV